MKKINIGIDGPAGSGKGTLAKIVAKELGYTYIDTGVMYRMLAYLMIKNDVKIDEDSKIKELLINKFDYKVIEEKVYCDGKDVTLDIRSSEVNKIVAVVAGKKYVREFMVDLQKKIAEEKGVVMDGRDITSVVLKDAELKIYLDAELEERVKRRYIEELKKNPDVSYEKVKELMIKRDYQDIEVNKTLIIQEDSVVIDTTNLKVEETVSKVLELAKERINNG